MNVLYIIGNGLDIAYNLKTSYQDFFRNYLSIHSDDLDIISMKSNINKHKYDNWSDLEIGLGNYAKHCKTGEIFLKCLNNLKLALKMYLKEESKKIEQYETISYANFLSPGNLLEPEPKVRYDKYFKKWGTKESYYIDVITLNYTESLEYIFGYKKGILPMGGKFFLNSINHLHGTLDDKMVMGVNDKSQISNSIYNEDEEVMEEFIKPEFNDACMNNKNATCENLISEAHVIVLYGTSLGLSDDKWWKIIGKRMESNTYPLLIYVPYDQKKDVSAHPNHLRRWTKGYVEEIRKRFDIQLEDGQLSERVCVALNKSIFDVKKKIVSPNHKPLMNRR